ncbi:MAG: hypothetical protein LBF26_01325 [Puniceicoccales bacterium]|jgi:hypothetical protein|nr:hypothetical protein [Puniceicoccales bacterium]
MLEEVSPGGNPVHLDEEPCLGAKVKLVLLGCVVTVWWIASFPFREGYALIKALLNRTSVTASQPPVVGGGTVADDTLPRVESIPSGWETVAEFLKWSCGVAFNGVGCAESVAMLHYLSELGPEDRKVAMRATADAINKSGQWSKWGVFISSLGLNADIRIKYGTILGEFRSMWYADAPEAHGRKRRLNEMRDRMRKLSGVSAEGRNCGTRDLMVRSIWTQPQGNSLGQGTSTGY